MNFKVEYVSVLLTIGKSFGEVVELIMSIDYYNLGVDFLNLVYCFCKLSVSYEIFVSSLFTILFVFPIIVVNSIYFAQINENRTKLFLFFMGMDILKVILLGKISIVSLLIQAGVVFLLPYFGKYRMKLARAFEHFFAFTNKSNNNIGNNNNNNNSNNNNNNNIIIKNTNTSGTSFKKRAEDFLLFITMFTTILIRFILVCITFVTNTTKNETKANPIISVILFLFKKWYTFMMNLLETLDSYELNLKVFFIHLCFITYILNVPNFLETHYNYDPYQTHMYASIYLFIFIFYPLRFYPLFEMASNDNLFVENEMNNLKLRSLFFLVKDSFNVVLRKPLKYQTTRNIFTSAVVKFTSAAGLRVVWGLCAITAAGLGAHLGADMYKEHKHAQVAIYDIDKKADMAKYREDQKTERARIAVELQKEKNKSAPSKSNNGWF